MPQKRPGPVQLLAFRPGITFQHLEVFSRRLGLKGVVRVARCGALALPWVRDCSGPGGFASPAPDCQGHPGSPACSLQFPQQQSLAASLLGSLPFLQAALHTATRPAFLRCRIRVTLCLKGCAWLWLWWVPLIIQAGLKQPVLREVSSDLPAYIEHFSSNYSIQNFTSYLVVKNIHTAKYVAHRCTAWWVIRNKAPT